MSVQPLAFLLNVLWTSKHNQVLRFPFYRMFGCSYTHKLPNWLNDSMLPFIQTSVLAS